MVDSCWLVWDKSDYQNQNGQSVEALNWHEIKWYPNPLSSSNPFDVLLESPKLSL